METSNFTYNPTRRTFVTEASTLQIIPKDGFYMDIAPDSRVYFSRIEEMKDEDGDVTAWKYKSGDNQYFVLILND